MKRLLLVRHGETEWNGRRLLQGRLDLPLSETGRAQVRALLPLVTTYAPDHVVSSPLRRSAETADLLGLGHAVTDDRWQEADLGDWTGQSSARLATTDGQSYTAWRSGRFTPPGGEPFDDLETRVVAAYDHVRPLDGTVLVVTHGGPIRALCRRLIGLDPRHVVPVGPASLTVLDVADRPRLRAFNATVMTELADPPD